MKQNLLYSYMQHHISTILHYIIAEIMSSFYIRIFVSKVVLHLRVIKGTNVIAVIKRMQSRDKDQTWKTDIYNKEHKVTKIIYKVTEANEQLGVH